MQAKLHTETKWFYLLEKGDDPASSPGLYSLSSDWGIFLPSSSGDVTFDYASRTTGNEAGDD